MFKGLRSIIYPSSDLAADKAFWTNITGVQPYFDQPYYVGFDINGNELGLDPNARKQGLDYPICYWKVEDTVKAVEKLVADGATIKTDAKDVGDGMMMATLTDKAGNIFGVIDDPKN